MSRGVLSRGEWAASALQPNDSQKRQCVQSWPEQSLFFIEVSRIRRVALHTTLPNPVMMVMTERFHFPGRGNAEIAADSILLIEAAEGTVLGIGMRYGRAEVMVGYCRKALADRWGIYCQDPFLHVSSPDCRRSWAEHSPGGWFLFHAVCLNPVREEEWMKQSS